MTEVEVNKALADLEASARRLNVESDQINHIITDIEQRIRQTNVGLACWVSLSPASGQIGWSKWNEKWALLYRVGNDGNDPDGDGYDYTVLLSTSRDTRIRALKEIEHLIKLLNELARDAIETIERAKTLVR